ncbi:MULTISPECIES: hypothetical protein [unclassified Bradyrhizobium]|uniref:hypothetical protein n=1 Tax=unclassified Bradyrhizobium TaxID=2631580 RepID=UPI0028F02F2F|nr:MULTISPECIES: hypothetical protein [unclassified Bradyrhizobium]
MVDADKMEHLAPVWRCEGMLHDLSPRTFLADGIGKAIFVYVDVADRLKARDAGIFVAVPEQVREAALRLQIVLYRNLPADLSHLRDLATLGFEDRIEAAFHCEPCLWLGCGHYEE